MMPITETSAPKHKCSPPGAFPAEEEVAVLPRYVQDAYVFLAAQDEPESGGKHSGQANKATVSKPSKATTTREQQTKDERLEDKCAWLRQLGDLEAQPLSGEAEPEPVRKTQVVSRKVILTQQQCELMDQIEVLDILERGELMCCG